MGYWHRRADERHGNPPPRQPGAICGQRQSWKTPGELGVSKSVECDIFTFPEIFCERGMAALLQGNQELLVVKDEVGRPHGSPWNVIFSFQCFDTVGWATGRASGL